MDFRKIGSSSPTAEALPTSYCGHTLPSVVASYSSICTSDSTGGCGRSNSVSNCGSVVIYEAGCYVNRFKNPGTDVMIFKIFSPKNLAKKLAFLTQNKAKFEKKFDHNIGF
jgi:hypothetical protein